MSTFHHQAPAGQPGLCVGRLRLDGRCGGTLPVSTMAAPACQSTGFVPRRDQPRPPPSTVVTGALDATGCDIGAYNPTKVANADIRGAR